MNILDIGIILLLIMFFILGTKTGIIREIVSLIGFIITFIIAYALKGVIGNLLCIILPFFKFSGALEGLVTFNILLYQLIAFMIVFSILLGIFSLIIRLSKVMQKIVNMTIVLIIPSKILGGVLSFIKGYIVLFAIILVLYIPLGETDMFNNSKMVDFMLYDTPVLSDSMTKYTKSIREVYSLTENIEDKSITINEANLKSLDIMLKYKVVNKKTVEKLITMKKLNIDNVNSVLKRY